MKTFFRKLNWLGFLILSQMPLPLMLYIPRLRGHKSYDTTDYAIFLVSFLVILLVTYFYAVRLKVIPKISFKQFEWKNIFSGFLALFLASMAAGMVSTYLGTTDTANQMELDRLLALSPPLIFAICTISAGFFEELVFRAGMFELLLPKHPKIAAFLSVSIFALVHVHGLEDLGSLVVYLAMSIVLTMLYYEYRNFYVNATVHALWNAMVTLIAISAMS